MGRPEADWLNQAGRYRLLTADQEVALGREVQAAAAPFPSPEDCTPEQLMVHKRALRARQRLTECNLRLVYRVVKGAYAAASQEERFLDLLQEGAQGVFHAAGLFDPDAGYRFSTYCRWWILHYCQKWSDHNDGLINKKSTLFNASRRFKKASKQLSGKLGREPTAIELGQELKISAADVQLIAERRRPMLRLDQPADPLGDSDGCLADVVSGDAPSLAGEDLAPLLQALSPLGRQSLLACWDIGNQTLADLARRTNLPEALLIQIGELALAQLRGERPASPGGILNELGVQLDLDVIVEETEDAEADALGGKARRKRRPRAPQLSLAFT